METGIFTPESNFGPIIGKCPGIIGDLNIIIASSPFKLHKSVRLHSQIFSRRCYWRVIVQYLDAGRGEIIPTDLRVRDVLKKIWRNLVLVGFLGAALFLKFSTSYIEFEFLVALLVLFEGALILIRILSLRERSHISKGKIAVSTIVGTLITSGATALLFFLFIIIGVFTGFLAQ